MDGATVASEEGTKKELSYVQLKGYVQKARSKIKKLEEEEKALLGQAEESSAAQRADAGKTVTTIYVPLIHRAPSDPTRDEYPLTAPVKRFHGEVMNFAFLFFQLLSEIWCNYTDTYKKEVKCTTINSGTGTLRVLSLRVLCILRFT